MKVAAPSRFSLPSASKRLLPGLGLRERPPLALGGNVPEAAYQVLVLRGVHQVRKGGRRLQTHE